MDFSFTHLTDGRSPEVRLRDIWTLFANVMVMRGKPDKMPRWRLGRVAELENIAFAPHTRAETLPNFAA